MKRFVLLAVVFLLFASSAYAGITDLNSWWVQDKKITELFYEPCTDGNLATWSGDTGDFVDDGNIFTRVNAGQKAILKFATIDQNTNGFKYHARVLMPSGAVRLDFFQLDGVNLINPQSTYSVGINIDVDIVSLTTFWLEPGPTPKSANLINVNLPAAGFPALSANTWIDVNISRTDAGTISMHINGTFIEDSNWPDFNYTGSSYIRIESATIGASFDDISLLKETTIHDINITKIQDFNVSLPLPFFGVVADGNLAIEFRVNNNDNNRLTVDINYSLTNAQGTGTVIVDDLNLSQNVCPNTNWDVNTAICSWDWDLTNVDDANYYIIATVNSGANEDFNATPQTVGIDSDVNLLILIPIDESTNTPIDTVSEFTFNVRILDDENLSITTGLTASDFFPIRKSSTDPVIVEIDTNDSSAYLSRQYQFSFDSGDFTATLQPYLVPVSEGISTKIVTQDLVDFSPIPGVRIDIYAIVLGSGRTLIETVTTDSKGEAFVSGVANDDYEYEVFFEGEKIRDFDVTVTSTLIVILFKRNVFPTQTVTPVPLVLFNPGFTKLLAGQTNLQQILSIENGLIQLISIYATETDDRNGIVDVNRYSVIIEPDANLSKTNTIIIATNLATWDTNKTLLITVDVLISDGSWRQFKTTYRGYNPQSISDQTWQILTEDIAAEFGCESVGNCGILTVIAVLLSVIGTAAFAAISNIRNFLGLTVISMVFLTIFLIFGWVPVYWWFIAALFTAVPVMVEWRR